MFFLEDKFCHLFISHLSATRPIVIDMGLFWLLLSANFLFVSWESRLVWVTIFLQEFSNWILDVKGHMCQATGL